MMKRLLFFLLISTIHTAVTGQRLTTADSIRFVSQIEKNKPGTDYADWLLQISNGLCNRTASSATDSALLFANKAATVSLELNYAKGIGNSYITISKLLRKTHQEEKSKDYINKAVKVFAGAHLYTDLGFAYWELSGYYDLSKPGITDKISFIERSVAAFHQAGNSKKEADALKELADVRQVGGDYVRAFSELKQSLKLYLQIKEPVLQGVYDLMGDVSCSIGNFSDAVRYGLLALQAAGKTGDTTLQLCTIYNHLGITYYYFGDFNLSVAYYQKALSVAKKYKAYNDIYLITTNLGNSLIRMNRFADCNQLLNALLKEYPAGIDTAFIIQSLSSLVFNCIYLEEFGEAKKYFDELTAIVNNRKLSPEMQRGFYKAAIRYLLATGQNNKARSYLEAEEKYLSASKSLPHLADNQLSWISYDSAVGDYRSAFHHFRKYIPLKDSIYSREKGKYIEQLKIQFETAEKDQDILLKEKNITLLQQETGAKQKELLQANQTRNWILAAILLLTVIIGLLINSARLKQRTNKELTNKQEEIEKKNSELQHLVNEKEWLVKEIHHRVKNNFHIVQGLLGTQSGYLKSKEAVDALAESRHRVQAMSLIHQKLYQSESLSSINMADYIHDLAGYLRDSFSSTQSIRFNVKTEPVELDLSHCIPLGLIINEAVTNAIKYAFPGNRNGIINILFNRTAKNNLSLVIADNGIGLPGDLDMEHPVSMGIKLMKGLSEDIDAAFSIHSNAGTEITLSFTFDPGAADHYKNKNELSTRA